MREILGEAPDWSKYGPGSQPTLDIKTYWITKELGGGPVTGNFNTWRTKDIAAPLGDLLGMKTTYGLYELDKVTVEADKEYFRDVAILSTVEEDAEYLRDMS